MTLRLIGLLFGAAFGFVLGWARVTEYDVIHDMLLLRSPYVFLLMMSAIVTAGIGVRVLRMLGVHTVIGRAPVSWHVQPPARHHLARSHPGDRGPRGPRARHDRGLRRGRLRRRLHDRGVGSARPRQRLDRILTCCAPPAS